MTKALMIIIGLGIVVGGVWWWTDSQSSLEDEKMTGSESMMKPNEEKMMESDTKMEDAGMMEKRGDTMMEKPAMETKEGSMMKSEVMMGQSERYVTYSKESLEQTKESRRVLFFYASWCPNCKPADAEFREKISEIPSDVTVVRVNYNDPDTDQEEKDLARKYGVTYQHTFVQIDKDGQVVTKWNGGKMAELLKNIK